MMKDLKLIEMFKQGHMVIPLFLMQNYKKFNIKLDEFIFLMYLYNCGNKFVFDPSKFSAEMGIELKDVMNYIDVLTSKKLIRVEVLKNDKGIMEDVVVLDDFFSKLGLLTMEEVNKVSKSDGTDIFEVIEKEFGRTLSPMEYEIIKAWLDNDFSVDLIKEAVKEATMNGVSNLRYIDKILYEWGKNGIKTVTDVENNRKKFKEAEKKNLDSDADLTLIDWNWFDDDE